MELMNLVQTFLLPGFYNIESILLTVKSIRNDFALTADHLEDVIVQCASAV